MADNTVAGSAAAVAKSSPSDDPRAAMNYPLVKYTDMPEEVRLEAVDAITSAMEKYCMVEQTTGPSRSYDVACKLVASTMNKKYGPSWNCVAGTSYATSDVVCQQRTCLMLYYGGQFAILLYKNI